MTYFEEKGTSKFKLSELMQKDYKEFSPYYRYFAEGKQDRETEYIISAIGNVELGEKDYIEFIRQFSIYSTRYDVRHSRDTFRGIYAILQKYPSLSSKVIEDLFDIYIKDLFEEYSLIDILQDFIDKYGETDEAFEKYYEYVEEKADELDAIYAEESKKAESLTEMYGESFTAHIRLLIEKKHYSYADIDKWIPSPKIVKADEKKYLDFEQAADGLYSGRYKPFSYSILDDLVEGVALKYGDRPQYKCSSGYEVDAPFTIQEYLDSAKERQRIKHKILASKG